MIKSVWFWRDVYPLLVRFCREQHVPLNSVVNEACQQFLSGSNVAELRLKARLSVLLREECELRRVTCVMLRSGSYLPGYVQNVLREPGRAVSLVREGQVPLKALNPKEEAAFRKIASRREAIAQEIADIKLEMLKEVKPFRLKPEPRDWSRRRRQDRETETETQVRKECADHDCKEMV